MNSLRIVDKLLCLVESTKFIFNVIQNILLPQRYLEVYLEFYQRTYLRKLFGNVIIFAKCLVMDIWQGFKYVSDILKVRSDITVKMPKFSQLNTTAHTVKKKMLVSGEQWELVPNLKVLFCWSKNQVVHWVPKRPENFHIDQSQIIKPIFLTYIFHFLCR